MVRSGCVSKRRRAGSPTITLPSGSRLTTDGQRVDPLGPGIHFGAPVCGSMYATRLFVVPRSIPTVLAIAKTLLVPTASGLRGRLELQGLHLEEFLLDVGYQISYVGAAI